MSCSAIPRQQQPPQRAMQPRAPGVGSKRYEAERLAVLEWQRRGSPERIDMAARAGGLERVLAAAFR